MSDKNDLPINGQGAESAKPAIADIDDELNDSAIASSKSGNNDFFRAMFDHNFLDYANYVIGSRAIPDVDDGLKPVQRRILWSLYLIYDNGKTTKTANVVGNTMHYHPHGDASISEAIVVLANKGGRVERDVIDERTLKPQKAFVEFPYCISKQGNFGNILTGSPAAAARYTECSLTELAYETMFSNEITAFVPNYDGRSKEPVVLPAKLPYLLMLGSDGIAVGMSTLILPHNFNELLDAEIAILQNREFQLYPDFQQGGIMDVRNYKDGNGKIVLRAKTEIDGRDIVIREIPATCTTESLVASIEKAASENKIKISSVNDYTTDRVEIRVTPMRGQDVERTLRGLYMYTACSKSISPNMMVICDHRPRQMSVTEVLQRNVQKLLEYFKREFEIEMAKQYELHHAKTLAQLFFENRIYKRIEECKDQKSEYKEVLDGLAPFRDQLLRDVTNDDVDKLLALPVRRIARFDIEKNQRELREIEKRIKEIKYNLAHLSEYSIGYLTEIKKKYGANFPRHTVIENIEQIDRNSTALNNIKIGWDRKNGYIGTAVKSDDVVVCNEFDHFLLLQKNGSYKVIGKPAEKMFVGKLYDFRRYDEAMEFGVVYLEKKTGKSYCKRSSFGGFIKDKEYHLIPDGCVLELFTPRADAIYSMITEDGRKKQSTVEINLMELFPQRTAKARGVLLTNKSIIKLTHVRYLEPEELAKFINEEKPTVEADGDEEVPNSNTTAPIEDTNKDDKVEQPKTGTNKPKTDNGNRGNTIKNGIDEIKQNDSIQKKPNYATEPNADTNGDARPAKPVVEPAANESTPVIKSRKKSNKKLQTIEDTNTLDESKTSNTIDSNVVVEPTKNDLTESKEDVPSNEIEKSNDEAPKSTKTADDEPSKVNQAGDLSENNGMKKADSPKQSAKSDDEPDEFGIVQPEFGF